MGLCKLPVVIAGWVFTGCACLILAGCGGGGGQLVPPATDTTPPQITGITGVSDGGTVAGVTAIAATATDNVGVTGLSLTIDAEVAVSVNQSPLQYSWDTSQMQSGAHDLVFTALDAAGLADSISYTVTIAESESNDGQDPPVDGEQLPVEETTDSGELPGVSADNYDPTDSEPPVLLVSGLAEGKLVWGEVHISAFALDDTGVNTMGFLVNGVMVELREGCAVDTHWDTTQYADGPILIGFMMRDNGNKVYISYLTVQIDNSAERNAPVITLEGFDEYISGLHTLRANFIDESDIASSKMSFYHDREESGGVVPESGSFTIEQGMGSTFEWVWDTAAAPDRRYSITVQATDVHGNVGRVHVARVQTVNHTTVKGAVSAANGAPLGNVLVCVLAENFSGEYSELPDQEGCLGSALTGFTGHFDIPDVINGDHTLYMCRDGREHLAAIAVPVIEDHYREVDVTETTAMPGLRSERYQVRSSYRIPDFGVVTGEDDNLDELAEHLLANDEGRFIRGDMLRYDGIDEAATLETGFANCLRGELYSDDLWRNVRTLFIDSGTHCEAEILADRTLRDALRNWVRDGGRLVVIGRSYDYVEQIWPDKIDFAGDDAIDGLSCLPEQRDAAQVGVAWPGTGGDGAEFNCLLQHPATWWFEGNDSRNMKSAKRQYLPSLPLFLCHKMYCDIDGTLLWDPLAYDDAADTVPMTVTGFHDGWPVIKRVAADVAVWITLDDAPTADILRGTPLMVSFSDELGDVFVFCPLLVDGNLKVTSQVHIIQQALDKYWIDR
ncbi:hypothetical protein JW859_05710 [bacterium]|nr:hypothetical protein [bacterium]